MWPGFRGVADEGQGHAWTCVRPPQLSEDVRTFMGPSNSNSSHFLVLHAHGVLLLVLYQSVPSVREDIMVYDALNTVF